MSKTRRRLLARAHSDLHSATASLVGCHPFMHTSSTVKVPIAPNNSGEGPGTNVFTCGRMQSTLASLSTFIVVHKIVEHFLGENFMIYSIIVVVQVSLLQ